MTMTTEPTPVSTVMRPQPTALPGVRCGGWINTLPPKGLGRMTMSGGRPTGEPAATAWRASAWDRVTKCGSLSVVTNTGTSNDAW